MSILKCFNLQVTHKCKVGSLEEPYGQLQGLVDKDENFSIPAVTPGVDMKFKVVSLLINQNPPKAIKVEPGWTMVKGKKAMKSANTFWLLDAS